MRLTLTFSRALGEVDYLLVLEVSITTSRDVKRCVYNRACEKVS
jgi:hypothetical protein